MLNKRHTCRLLFSFVSLFSRPKRINSSKQKQQLGNCVDVQRFHIGVHYGSWGQYTWLTFPCNNWPNIFVTNCQLTIVQGWNIFVDVQCVAYLCCLPYCLCAQCLKLWLCEGFFGLHVYVQWWMEEGKGERTGDPWKVSSPCLRQWNSKIQENTGQNLEKAKTTTHTVHFT